MIMERMNMKRILHQLSMWMFAITFIAVASCNDDDDGFFDDDDDIDTLDTDPEETTFTLNSVGNSNATGTITFREELSDGSVRITVITSGLEDGAYPAYIYHNNVADPGEVAITLEPIDGGTDSSQTVVSTLDDGTDITYSELTNFDGFVNVLQSDQDSTVILQADIGANRLTGETVSYHLDSTSNSEVYGTVTFHQRENNETFVEFMLNNTPEDGMHPAHIHENSVAEGGDIVVTFNPVDGATGMSRTNISTTDADVPISYDEILEFDGHINVHKSADELDVLIAQGNIGANEDEGDGGDGDLTGESSEFSFISDTDAEINGTVTFHERTDGQTRAEIILEDFPEGSHPVHIHTNTAADSGDVVYTFDNVEGPTDTLTVDIDTLDDGTSITYQEFVDFNGYIDVHQSDDDNQIIAHTDIGQNALTENTTTFNIDQLNDSGVSGTATFTERASGATLVDVDLDGAIGNHPVSIFSGTPDNPGEEFATLNTVGVTGRSATNVSEDINGNTVSFTDLTETEGHINVFQDDTEAGMETIIAQGNVGTTATD